MAGPTVVPIPRVSNSNPQLVKAEYFAKNRPCILEDPTKHGWEAFNKWSLESIKAQFGEEEMKVTGGLPTDGRENVPYDLTHSRQYIHGPYKLSHIIDSILNGKDDYYLNQVSFGGIFKSIESQVKFEDVVPFDEENRFPHLWIGCKGTKSGWHFDLADNMIIQVCGQKKVQLVAPVDSPFMHPYLSIRHKSQVDPTHPERFRWYKYATVYEGVLNPGDVLILPVMWWHYITSLSPNISINCWVDQSSVRPLGSQQFTRFQRFSFYVHSWFAFWKALLGFPAPGRLFSPQNEGVPEGLAWHNYLRSWLRIKPLEGK